MNKKSQVASTITWVVAFFIIFFIMILFMLGVIGIAGIKIVGQSSSTSIANYEIKDDTTLMQEFIVFLDSEVDFEGKKILVKDLVADVSISETKNFEKFKELADKFVEDKIKNKGREAGWIKIYAWDEEAGKKFTGAIKPTLYSAYTSSYAKSASSAQKTTEDDRILFCNLEDSSSLSSVLIISKDKKIGFCAR